MTCGTGTSTRSHLDHFNPLLLDKDNLIHDSLMTALQAQSPPVVVQNLWYCHRSTIPSTKGGIRTLTVWSKRALLHPLLRHRRVDNLGNGAMLHPETSTIWSKERCCTTLSLCPNERMLFNLDLEALPLCNLFLHLHPSRAQVATSLTVPAMSNCGL